MGIYKRGETWWVAVSYRGRQVRRSTGTADRALAKRIFDKIKGDIAEGRFFERLPGEDITFRELMRKYLEYSKRRKASSSHKREKSILKNLGKHFGDCYLTELRARDIAE